jgi:2'-5' RNA ligase
VPVLGLPLDAHTAPGLPPHITVLYPFVPARRANAELTGRLHEALAGFAAFPFTLTEVRRFPGVLYVAPEPAWPFVALTEACVARWPEHPPYGGAHAEVIPHLSLTEGDEPAGAAERAAAQLPLHARAEEVWLMAHDRGGHWRECARIPLSGSPRSPSP